MYKFLFILLFISSPAYAEKILFELKGQQQIVEVGVGGGVASDAIILWREKLDGPLPANIELGKMSRVGSQLVKAADVKPEHAAKEKEEQDRVEFSAAAKYLALTDSRFIEEFEGGRRMPDDMRQKRIDARAKLLSLGNQAIK